MRTRSAPPSCATRSPWPCWIRSSTASATASRSRRSRRWTRTMIAAARPDLQQLDVFGDLGLRELLAAGAGAARGAARDPRARVPRDRRRARRGAAGVPARDRRGAARGRDRAARRSRAVRGPPARKTEAELAGIRRATARGRAGARGWPPRRCALRMRNGVPTSPASACAAIVRDAVEARGRRARRVHRRQRPGGRHRPRLRQRADRARRARDRRPLAAGPRDRLLHRHRAHVRRRRRRTRRSRAGTSSCSRRWRRRSPTVRPGVTGRQLWEQTCDHFEAHGFSTQRKPGRGG